MLQLEFSLNPSADLLLKILQVELPSFIRHCVDRAVSARCWPLYNGRERGVLLTVWLDADEVEFPVPYHGVDVPNTGFSVFFAEDRISDALFLWWSTPFLPVDAPSIGMMSDDDPSSVRPHGFTGYRGRVYPAGYDEAIMMIRSEIEKLAGGSK